jgi:hypothetical protein
MLVILAFQRLFDTKLSEHCVALFDLVLIADRPSLTGVDSDSGE